MRGNKLSILLIAGMCTGSTTAGKAVLINGEFVCNRIVSTGTGPTFANKQVLGAAINDAHHVNSDVKYIVANGCSPALASLPIG